jgi:hypothetical protein
VQSYRSADGRHLNVLVANEFSNALALILVVFDDQQTLDGPIDEVFDARNRVSDRVWAGWLGDL